MGKKIIAFVLGVYLMATLVSCVQTRGGTLTWSSDEYLIYKVFPSDTGSSLISCCPKKPPNDNFVTIRIGVNGSILWKLETDEIPQAFGNNLYAFDANEGTTSIFNKDTGKLINTVKGKLYFDFFDKSGFFVPYITFPKTETVKQSTTKQKTPDTTIVKFDLQGNIIWKTVLHNTNNINNISQDDKTIIIVCDIPEINKDVDPSSLLFYGVTRYHIDIDNNQNTSIDYSYCCWDDASKPRPVISVFYLDRETGRQQKRLGIEAKGNYNINLQKHGLVMFIKDIAGTRFVNLSKGTVKTINNEYPGQFSCFNGKVLALPDTLYSETNGMFCLDFDGANILWSKRVSGNDIIETCILEDCILIYSNLGKDWQDPSRKIEALDKATGKTIWKKECSSVETNPEYQIETFTIQKTDGSSNQCIIIGNKPHKDIYSLIEVKTGNNIFTVDIPENKAVLDVKMFGNRLYMVYQDSVVEFDVVTGNSKKMTVWQRVYDPDFQVDTSMSQQKIDEMKSKTYISNDVIILTCERDTLIFDIKAFETIAFLPGQTFNHFDTASKTVYLWKNGKLKKITY